MSGFVREIEIDDEWKQRLEESCDEIRREERADFEDLVVKLTQALKHAQEALFWHNGLEFEVDGKKAKFVIADALASASRLEARR